MRMITRSFAAVLAAALMTGGTLAVAAQSPAPPSDLMAAAHVTGRHIFDGDLTVSPTITTVDGVRHYRGGETWTGIDVEASDPRLTGELASTFDRDVHPGGIGVVWGTMTITNDDGAWTGEFIGPIRHGDGYAWRNAGQLTGSGAYEGLSLIILQEDDGRFEGVIVPGELPGS